MNPNGSAASLKQLYPAAWPVIWAHVFAGFILAIGPTALDMSFGEWMQGTLAALLWAICLGAPAIGLTRLLNPQRPASSIAAGWLGLCLILVGLMLALIVSWGYFEAYLVAVIIIVVQSTPPVRLARFETIGLVAEALGLGAITLLAGFAAADRLDVMPETLLCAGGFAMLYLSLRGILMKEGVLAAGWVYWIAAAAGFAGIVISRVPASGLWHAFLPLIAAPLWLGAGLRRMSGLAHAPLAASTALGIWFATDLALVISVLVR